MDLMRSTYSRVLKMMTTRSAKKPMARRACLDRRMDRYITSIVLYAGSDRRSGYSIQILTEVECCYNGMAGRHEAAEIFGGWRSETELTESRVGENRVSEDV